MAITHCQLVCHDQAFTFLQMSIWHKQPFIIKSDCNAQADFEITSYGNTALVHQLRITALSHERDTDFSSIMTDRRLGSGKVSLGYFAAAIWALAAWWVVGGGREPLPEAEP